MLRTVRTLLAVLLVAAAIPIHAQSTFTLSGTVYGGASPLSGAVVSALQDGTTAVVATATTNAQGRYSLLLAGGVYDLKVSPPAGSGFAEETIQNVNVDSDRAYDVVLLSSSTGTISGTISGRNGQPLPNVFVRASAGPVSVSTSTDANGRYSLMVGNGTAYVSGSGNGPAGAAPQSFSFERYNVAVNGATRLDISFPVVELKGRVIDPNGTAVASANVQAGVSKYENNGAFYSSGSLNSGADGRYTMLLAAGSGSITARPPSGSSLVAVSVPLSLTADTEKDLALGASVTLSGTVRGRNATPVANVFVRASVGPASVSTSTDANGRYTLQVANGTAYLSGSGNGPAGVAPQSFSFERYNVSIGGSTVVDIDLPIVELKGRVLDPNGALVAGASVQAGASKYENSGAFYSSASINTGADGRYAVLLAAGSGSATVRPPSGSSLVAVSASLSLTADTEKDFTLGASVVLSGTVRGRSGSPIPNVFVRASVGPASVATSTDANGRYTLQVPNGSAYVSGSGNGPAGIAPQSFSFERYNVAISGPTTLDIDFPAALVSGIVTDSNGAGIPAVNLQAGVSRYESNGAYYSSISMNTDAQGLYQYILARGNGSFTVRPPTATGFMPASLPLSLATDVTQRIILQRPDLVAPIITAGPIVVHLSDTSVSVGWTTNEASNSRVDYGIGGLSLSVTDNTLTTNHAVTLMNLSPQELYQFRVGSTDSSNNGPTMSGIGSFATQAAPGDITPPVFAKGPAIVSISQTSAVVQWETDEPTSGRADFGEGAPLGRSVASVAGRFIQAHALPLNGLQPSTRYYVQVTVADPDDNLSTSPVVSFVTAAVPDTAPPVIAAGPTIDDVTDTTITVRWTTDEPSTSGVSFNDGVRYDLVSDPTLVSDHVITLSGLRASTIYHLTVSSTDGVGNGPTLSPSIDAATEATPDTAPPAIRDHAVIEIGETSAVIVWWTDEPATSEVAFGTIAGSPDGIRSSLTRTTTHRIELNGLEPGTDYFAVIRATDAAGNQATSSELSFRTTQTIIDGPPTAPGPLTGPSSPTRMDPMTIGWMPAHDDFGIASYEVLRGDTLVATVGADVTHIEEAGLPDGTYDYVVRATDTAGHTSSSEALRVVVDRTPPALNLPASQVVDASSADGIVVEFSTDALDALDGPVTVDCAPPPGSLFPFGESDVQCSARDRAGNTASGTFSVTVRDVAPPSIASLTDLTAEAADADGAMVSFSEPAAADNYDPAPGVRCLPASGSTFAIGATLVTCTATDDAGNAASSSFTVNVVDTTAPRIAAATPSDAPFWPPNHQMVPVTVKVDASDAVAVPQCRISAVASNEPEDGLGDGDTPQDWIIGGDLRVQLRAERSGAGNGRVYTIEVTCRDAAGNASKATTAVSVPKSQGK